jgi:hypothetical protein
MNKLEKSINGDLCTFSLIKILKGFNEEEIANYNKENPLNKIIPFS